MLWTGAKEGLAPQEITIAELLSGAGYLIAMWVKWHIGELPEQAPENQGCDYVYYGLFNGALDSWLGSGDFYENNMPQPITAATISSDRNGAPQAPIEI